LVVYRYAPDGKTAMEVGDVPAAPPVTANTPRAPVTGFSEYGVMVVPLSTQARSPEGAMAMPVPGVTERPVGVRRPVI
jgi:hypothetical protein